MNNRSLFDQLEQSLRMESAYCSEDGILLKNAIVEAAMELRPSLLRLLLANEALRRHFFVEVDGTLVFDKVKLQRLVMNKHFLPDSYTAFKNKIGLVDGDGRFISDSREVVLAWPYKDCMLEGGQTKEDAKRNEVFWNETLAPDEVNRLTEPKALAGFRRYDADGVHPVAELSPSDNLIIKGNNLLVLHSLKRKYAKRIKVICIDPPYYFAKSKDSDTFCYNSNFKLSTWLTFMHNRLSVAKELLAPGGVIFCHIKEDAIHWLKVLMEEIFKVENFVETFIWKCTDNPDSLSKKSRSSVEYILCYEVPKNPSRSYVGKQTENGDAPILHTGNNVHSLKFPAGSIRFRIPDGVYQVGKPDRVEILHPVIVKNGINENEVELSGEFTWTQETLNENFANGCYFLVKSTKFSVRVQLPEGKSMAPEKYFDGQYLTKAIGVGSNEDASSHIASMGLKFPFSKPESVVAFLLRAVSQPEDIVLDFFLGSGTTAAVAMKMGRRFIGVDQMDYIQTTAVERLRKVIAGEQGGVSKAVGWHGGGSFVYCELAAANQRLVEAVNAATTADELAATWERIRRDGFLSWRVDPRQIDDAASEFSDLALADRRRFLIECLDKNLLYVPFSEIDNAEYCLSDGDKELTRKFYTR